jgi:hypothetical protein
MITRIRHQRLVAQTVTSSLELQDYKVAYLLKARTVETEKQPLLGKGYVTHNNGVTVPNGEFCAVRAEAI